MGILDSIGDTFVGTVTMGQCDDGGCGSGHRGSGLEAMGYNETRGVLGGAGGTTSQQDPASGALGLDFSSLSDGNKKLLVYAGFALVAYFLLKLSFDLIIKLI